ncbi:hypothetical protein, partial [Acinetobacter oleivorans]|uniref:hypothetical protein n=1 Tax=Acinetobacter oleivorans TaxID=1148157 RepID=UPI001D19763B
REAAEKYPDHLTFKPSFKRRFMRGFIEGLRVVLPAALAIGVGTSGTLSETTAVRGITETAPTEIITGLDLSLGKITANI